MVSENVRRKIDLYRDAVRYNNTWEFDAVTALLAAIEAEVEAARREGHNRALKKSFPWMTFPNEAKP